MNPLRPSTYVCKRCANTLAPATRANSKLQISGVKIQRRYTGHVTQSRRGPRVAVVGSGPAGFYAALGLISKIEDAVVDMYEQLPVPFGLVRFGVAPDHPEVKHCQDRFTEVAESPRFNFIGNIDLGNDLPLTAITPYYDAVLFAYGASKDKELGITGEKFSENVYSARAFVGWYNGLPEHASLNPKLDAGQEAVIIGQGNVALDVARILLTDVGVLSKTDISPLALAKLSKSKIRNVRIVGRRGPLQASFTIKELRELMNLPKVSFTPIPEYLLPSPSVAATLPRPQKRIVDLLRKGSPTLGPGLKSFSLDFLHAPAAFVTSGPLMRDLCGVSFDRMALPPDPECWSPRARATLATPPNLVSLRADIAFRSIGYQSTPLPGFGDLSIPFDAARGIIPNDGTGRVLVTHPSPFNPTEGQAVHLPGFYCTGWVARGPTGVIASTMQDAFAAADALAVDWESDSRFLNGRRRSSGTDSSGGWDAMTPLIAQRNLRPVSWSDWLKIDKVEKDLGMIVGKPREKLGLYGMFDVLDGNPVRRG